MAWHAPPVEAGDEDEILGKAYDGRLVRRFLPYLRALPPHHRRCLRPSAGQLGDGHRGPFLTKVAIDDDIAPSHGHVPHRAAYR